MARSSGLGKGLAALIPSEMPGEENDLMLRDIDMTHIVPNRFQPRTYFDEEALASLAESVAVVGVIQPIVVRETDDGYEILTGERRWRAAQRAGLTRIPALVRSSDDRKTLEVAIIENIQREDLNPLEEAAAYRQLTDDFGLTQKQVASRVGRSRSSVANTIRLLSLPSSVQNMIVEGRLSAGHGRALLSVKGDENREKLAEDIMENALSVRQAEQLVEAMGNPNTDPEPVDDRQGQVEESPETKAGILELEDLLTARLNTRVSVHLGRGTRSPGRGKIVIQFADLSDLERIYNVITPPNARLQ